MNPRHSRLVTHRYCGRFTVMLFARSITLFALLSPLASVHGQEMLYLHFGQGESQGGTVKTYGSATTSYPPVLSVLEGQRVVLQKSRGVNYGLQTAPQSWSWTQVQQIAAAETSISVMATREGGNVSVEVDYYLREGDQSVSSSRTVQGVLGQWLPLLQPAAPVKQHC